MASRKGRAADDVFIFSALVLGFSGRHTLLDALYLNTGISCCEPRVAPRRSVVKIEDPISYGRCLQFSEGFAKGCVVIFNLHPWASDFRGCSRLYSQSVMCDCLSTKSFDLVCVERIVERSNERGGRCPSSAWGAGTHSAVKVDKR